MNPGEERFDVRTSELELEQEGKEEAGARRRVWIDGPAVPKNLKNKGGK